MNLTTHATPRQVAESYWRAECQRDLEKVRQHYHPDAIFCPPGQRLIGWDAIKTYYEDSINSYPGLEVEIAHEVACGSEAALEWRAVLIDHDGVRHPLIGVNVVRVEEGRFREVHAYFDPALLTAA
jgi:ketosteroid isomerase-like protein